MLKGNLVVYKQSTKTFNVECNKSSQDPDTEMSERQGKNGEQTVLE